MGRFTAEISYYGSVNYYDKSVNYDAMYSTDKQGRAKLGITHPASITETCHVLGQATYRTAMCAIQQYTNRLIDPSLRRSPSAQQQKRTKTNGGMFYMPAMGTMDHSEQNT